MGGMAEGACSGERNLINLHLYTEVQFCAIRFSKVSHSVAKNENQCSKCGSVLTLNKQAFSLF